MNTSAENIKNFNELTLTELKLYKSVLLSNDSIMIHKIVASFEKELDDKISISEAILIIDNQIYDLSNKLRNFADDEIILAYGDLMPRTTSINNSGVLKYKGLNSSDLYDELSIRLQERKTKIDSRK